MQSLDNEGARKQEDKTEEGASDLAKLAAADQLWHPEQSFSPAERERIEKTLNAPSAPRVTPPPCPPPLSPETIKALGELARWDNAWHKP